MKSIVLLRFHKNPLIVKNRIRLLKNFNPGIEIYGLYGGESVDFPRMKKYLRRDFHHIFRVNPKYKGYLWLNGDLALVEWYKKIGQKRSFDRLYLVEWDAVVFEPLETAFENIPVNVIGLTGLRFIKDAEKTWYWTSHQPWRDMWLELLRRVRRKYCYQGNEMAAIFPLPVFPRKFLDDYSKIKFETFTFAADKEPKIWESKIVPTFQKGFYLSHDEIRLPLYAEILGYQMIDTGFSPKEEEEKIRCFNANNRYIEIETIQTEVKNRNGRRVFHPYRKMVPKELFEAEIS